MKNFYEVTATRSALTVELELVLKPIGTVPTRVQINDLVLESIISDQPFVIKEKIKLTDNILISVFIQNRQHPMALQVEAKIDGFEVLPKYQHLASPPTDYLNTTESWTFSISNFYPWYHEITGQGWIA